MKIMVAKYEFPYCDTDMNSKCLQDEIKEMAQEAARCEHEDYDFCYNREIENFKRALEWYTTTLEITVADIEYKMEKEYGKLKEFNIIDVTCYKTLLRYHRKEYLDSTLSTENIRKALCAKSDEGEESIFLYDEDSDLYIEVEVAYKTENGEHGYDFVSFEPRW